MTTGTLKTPVSFSADARKHATVSIAFAGGTITNGASAEFASNDWPGAVSFNFNDVAEPKAAGYRDHLDITVKDVPTATDEAVKLSGTAVFEHGGSIVLRETRGQRALPPRLLMIRSERSGRLRAYA